MDKKINVAILSPSDTSEERKAVRDTIQEINQIVQINGYIVTEKVYEDMAPKLTGEDPQSYIDNYIKGSNIFIAIFATNLGRGNTIHEVYNALNELKSKPQNSILPLLMIFFQIDNRIINQLTANDIENVLKIRNAKTEFEKIGLIGSYNNKDDLCKQIRLHILNYILK